MLSHVFTRFFKIPGSKNQFFRKCQFFDVFHLWNHFPDLQDGYFDPLDRYKNSKKKLKIDFLYFFSILLINLSWTAQIHDLTAANNRFFDVVLVGIDIIFIRPIWCPVMAPGPILLYISWIDHRYIIDISSIYHLYIIGISSIYHRYIPSVHHLYIIDIVSIDHR